MKLPSMRHVSHSDLDACRVVAIEACRGATK